MKYSDMAWGKFTSFGMAMVGKPYKFGAETDIKKFLQDPRPETIEATDCSELVQIMFALIGIDVVDGSYNQNKSCRIIQPDEHLRVGDLGFKAFPDTGVIHHVGIYLDGVPEMVLEAKGKDYGVILTPLSAYMASTHFSHWGRLKVFDA